MRRLMLGVASTALCCAPASAATIVQDLTAFNSNLALFDPSKGALFSVVVEGTQQSHLSLVRLNAITFPAVDVPVTSGGGVGFSVYSSFAPTLLTGSEHYDAGSIFGSINVSGAISTTFTGSDLGQFIYVNGSLFRTVLPNIAPQMITPTVGQIVADHSNSNSFAVRITYNYIGPQDLPEPATWAMMLLGFAGIGLSVRRRRPLVTA